MTLAVVVAPSTSGPAMRVTVTSSVGTDNQPLTLVRTHADGTIEPVLMGSARRLIAGSWTGFDWHCPFNQPVTYVATTASAASPASTARTLHSDSSWVVPALEPGRAVRIAFVESIGDPSFTPLAGVFRPAGRSGEPQPKQIVVWDDSIDETGSIEFAVLADQAAALRALAGGPLLLNLHGAWDFRWGWVQPKGAIVPQNKGTNSMPGGKAAYRYRHVALDYTPVATPIGRVVSPWTSKIAGDYWKSQGVNSGELGDYYATALDFGTDTRL